MKLNKRILITLLSLVGLALAIELCVVYYNANFVSDAKPSICAISDSFDCDGVAKSVYSQFLGIPLSLWGVCLYLFVLFMTFVDKLKNVKFLGFLSVFKNPASYIFCISLLSFVISMCLGYISVKKIDSICIFCFMTYAVDLVIALVAKDWGNGFLYELKTSFADFFEAIKVPRYAFWFSLLVILGCSVVTYTAVSNVLAPQAAKQAEMKKFMNEYKNITFENELGPKDANVVIKEFMDFNCGGCFFANLYLHRIVTEFKNVKVIQYNLPLDITCNKNMQFEGHKTSCLKSSYALAALKQDKYWEMSDLLFAENPEDEKAIIQASRLLDIDIKQLKSDANSDEIKQRIQENIKIGDSMNVDATPTLFVGVRRVMGIRSYPELKLIVKEQGGIEKEE